MGIWNREAIEGFVVRTHLVDYPSWLVDYPSWDATPYKPGSTHFFKVKFDEPYMMYRDWREITKKLLSTKGPIDHVSTPKNKMKRSETKVYVRCLDWLASEEGKEGIKTVEEGETKGVKTFGETIIVPVAIPGCCMSSFFLLRRKLIFQR